MKPFMNSDGTVTGWPHWLKVGDNGRPLMTPDKYGAMQLLVAAASLRAAAGSDDAVSPHAATFERLLKERPALPLLQGLIHFALAFSQGLYGGQRDEILNQAALAYALDEDTPPEGTR